MTGLPDVETVGVLGERADDLAAFVREHDRDAVTGDAADVASADLVVADGAAAVYEFVRTGAETPVLVLGEIDGVPSAAPDRHPNALTHAFVGRAAVERLSVLAVDVGDASYRALADAMVVTDDPARISEYGIRTGGTAVDTVRADGVTVSTSVGSTGYGSAADGPVVAPAVDGVSVVPVAPFRVDQSNWVLSLPVSLTVEREEAPITLLVDDRDTGLISHDTPVRIDRGDALRVVTTPAMTRFF